MVWRFSAFILLAFLAGCSAINLPEVTRGQPLDETENLQTPEGYKRLFSPARHAFLFGRSEADQPVRRGALSERFELRDGDCGGADCVSPRARAEIQMLPGTSQAEIGEDIWYGWSFYNANVPSFSRDRSLRLVFGQWTVGGQERPIFRFIQLGRGEGDFSKCDPAICRGPNLTEGDVVVQLQDMARIQNWGEAQNSGYVCRLFDLQSNQGQWVDLTVNTNFAPGPDGFLRIWVNGELQCDYRGPMVSASSLAAGSIPTHRRGIFSSWTKRWLQSTGGARRPTMVVYYDEFTSGTARAEVDVKWREGAGLPPVN